MRILMVAPLPFFQPRGAPFQVYYRARALGEQGHAVDLLVYHVGETVELPNVRVYRALPIPFVRTVKVGPSLAKFPLDAALFASTVRMLLTHRYDVLHTHLEAGLFGAILAKIFRLPHLYDMHDDLAETLANSKFTHNKLLIGLMRGAVRTTLRSACAIIMAYPELQATVDALAPGKPTILITNVAVNAADEPQAGDRTADLARLRRELAIPEGSAVLLYTGTFEPYQGLEALVDSMPDVLASYPNAVYVLVGGLAPQIEAIRQRARRVGAEHALRLTGRRPHEQMPLYMELADILLSPRFEGVNTPLKLFSYLDAARPILATNIQSNTQILTPDVALLVAPTAQELAHGATTLLSDATLCERLALNARHLSQQRYGYDAFVRLTNDAYHRGLGTA